MKPYRKDILRTIIGEKKRLLALMIISALGVTMMTGLKASCDDLRFSADALFDAQKLHDIEIVSTLGLKDADVNALEKLETVEKAEGNFSKKIQIELKDGYSEALFKTFTKGGIDEPYVIEGRLPENAGETAVTLSYIKDSGKKLGDTIKTKEELDEEEEEETIEGFEELKEEVKPSFKNTEYKIVGIVTDVTAVVNPSGSTSFRSTGTEDNTAFVTWDAVDTDYYTSVNLTINGARETDCFSSEYDALIRKAKRDIESLVKENRQQAAYNEIRTEAEDKINDAEKKVTEKLIEADLELQEAEKELHDGKVEMDYGQLKFELGVIEAKSKIADAREEIADGRAQLEDGLRQLDEAAAEIDKQENELKENETGLLDAAAQITEGKTKLEEGKQSLQQQESETIAQLDGGIAQAQQGIESINYALSLLDPTAENYAEQYAALSGQLSRTQSELSELQSQKTKAQQGFAKAWEEINAQETELNQNEAKVNEGLAEIETGKAQIAEARHTLEEKYVEAEEGRKELDEGEQQLLDGEKLAEEELTYALKELEKGKKELSDGEKELEDGKEEFEDKKAEAKEKLRDARDELEDIPDCVWYVRDRSALNGFADIKSDAGCIQSIGTFFPIMFLLVAVLISLTTINRMVEENRGLIGTYQALGFRDREIRRKFAVYSATASIAGGIVGNICGFVVLPEIIIVIFKEMYLIPEYTLGYDPISGVGGIILFFAAIVGTTVISCNVTVRKMPAVLMRPKAPKAGSRILLEYITPVWRRMSFLNKVTARNLFRYKKRFLMTVLGIAGCTGILLCGFSIKDTVADLLPRQYEQIISYDIMAVTAGDEDFDKLKDFLESRKNELAECMDIKITTVDIHNEAGDTMAVPLYVLPDGENQVPFFTLKDLEGGAITVADDGFYITENISTYMGFEKGDLMSIQDTALNESQASVREVIEYYLGNGIFTTERMYEKLFEECTPNAVLLCISNTGDEAKMWQELNTRDEVLSVTSVGDIKANFQKAFLLMNMVVYVVIVLAGALAFAVLFTLSATNVSERDREIATIKVLGFFDGEVHTYINKETLILTLIGIIAGMPLGVYLGNMLGSVLKMPDIIFRTVVHQISYAYAGGITLIFAIIVNIITNKIIDRVDPIEALKCVE